MKNFSRLFAAVAAAVLVAPPYVLAQPTSAQHSHDASSAKKGNSTTLIDKVRAATAQYLDINVALHESEPWVRGTPCVSGPNSGAMGVHFIKPSRVFDGALNANEPEALIYEPGEDREAGVPDWRRKQSRRRREQADGAGAGLQATADLSRIDRDSRSRAGKSPASGGEIRRSPRGLPAGDRVVQAARDQVFGPARAPRGAGQRLLGSGAG